MPSPFSGGTAYSENWSLPEEHGTGTLKYKSFDEAFYTHILRQLAENDINKNGFRNMNGGRRCNATMAPISPGSIQGHQRGGFVTYFSPRENSFHKLELGS